MPTNWKEVDPERMVQTLEWLETNVLEGPDGRQIKRAIKKAAPQVNFPELEMEDRMIAKEKELEERIGTFEKTQKDKENKDYWEKERKRLRDKYELSDEDLELIKKHMIDNHVGSMEIAARDYTNFVKAPAEPTNYQERTGIMLPSQDGLMKDPAGWANQEAFKVLNEITRGSRSS